MQAMIQQDLLLWAVERASATIDVLSKKIQVNEDKIVKWLKGEDKPTFKQAQKLAKILQIPFGYLFLSEIPQEKLPLPDFRTIKDEPTYHISPILKELLYDLDRKQRWFKDYTIENGGEPLDFIGKFSLNSPKEEIVADIRKKLKWSDNFQKSSKENYISTISKSAEKLGIVVMRSSYFGGSTQKSIKVDELRGLAISDEYAPLVFVNTADAKSAQIFTLAHELAHLWIGESGISDLQKFVASNNHVEKFCNEISAELLVPQKDFMSLWHRDEALEENAKKLSDRYLVSPIMIAKRAYDLKFISYVEYSDFYAKQTALWKTIKEKQKEEKKSSGDYYRTTPVRLGRLFSESVVYATLEGKLLYRDATKLLNMTQMSTFKKYAKEIRGY